MDPISDMIIRLKNGSVVKRESVLMPYSNMKNAIALALLRIGYITAVAKRSRKVGSALEITLRYDDGKSRIKDVSRVSKPSRRVYMGVEELRSVKSGHGALMLSTPKGILTEKEAKKELVGGEALFKIW
ncbi:MAG: 30S ribosomal protein S8 [Patescibacteria group bacterium]